MNFDLDDIQEALEYFPTNKPIKEVLQQNVNNEDIKQIGNFASQFQNLAKGFINHSSEDEEKRSSNDSSNEDEEEEEEEEEREEKEKEKEKEDKHLEKKESIKNGINDLVGNVMSLNEFGDFTKEDEEITKNTVNYVLENGKEIANHMNQFPEETKQIKNCVHFVAKNQGAITKTIDNLIDNKQQLKDKINENIGDESIKNVINYALDNEELTKNALKVGLGAVQYADKECTIF